MNSMKLYQSIEEKILNRVDSIVFHGLAVLPNMVHPLRMKVYYAPSLKTSIKDCWNLNL